MPTNWKQWNWRAAFPLIIGAIYLSYQEIRDDHDDNTSTVYNSELVNLAWAGVIGILLGTTTTGQTQNIAKKEAENAVDSNIKS